MAQESTSELVFRSGVRYGALIAAANAIYPLLAAFHPRLLPVDATASEVTRFLFVMGMISLTVMIVVLLATALCAFLAGAATARATGQADNGALAGLAAGVIGGVIGAIVKLTVVSLLAGSNGPNTLAAAQDPVSVIILVALGLFFDCVIGTGAGVLGGLFGAWRDQQARQAPPQDAAGM